jgi:hypothetical protein
MVYREEFINPVKSFSSRAHIRGYPYLSKCTEALKQLGFMHLKVDLIIFSKNESVFDFSRLRTTIYNWKNKRSLNSHKNI